MPSPTDHETVSNAGQPSDNPRVAKRSAIITDAERHAMARALELARLGPAHGPNPRVGCVILSADGQALSEGHHRGAGSAHAEADAIASANSRGLDIRGATALVTLEPCNHKGRTPPCSQAIVSAGIVRVIYATSDPYPNACGGGAHLESAGVQVVHATQFKEAEELLRSWLHAVTTGRPYVTVKMASSLDGRVAAADGTSRWITSEASREHSHQVRATVDAIIIGTGTLLTDDPALTARPLFSRSAAVQQPLRVVVGYRAVPESAALLRSPGGRILHFATHDPSRVLASLARREVRHVLIEGGPTLISAFLRAGLVDEIQAYMAPVILGSGLTAMTDIGVKTIARAQRWNTAEILPLGPDVLIRYLPMVPPEGSAPATPQDEATPEDGIQQTEVTVTAAGDGRAEPKVVDRQSDDLLTVGEDPVKSNSVNDVDPDQPSQDGRAQESTGDSGHPHSVDDSMPDDPHSVAELPPSILPTEAESGAAAETVLPPSYRPEDVTFEHPIPSEPPVTSAPPSEKSFPTAFGPPVARSGEAQDATKNEGEANVHGDR